MRRKEPTSFPWSFPFGGIAGTSLPSKEKSHRNDFVKEAIHRSG